MEGDRGDVVKGLVDRPVVQRLYVSEGMGKLQARHAHLIGCEAVEHKRVVGIRAVGDADFLDQRVGNRGSGIRFHVGRRGVHFVS